MSAPTTDAVRYMAAMWCEQARVQATRFMAALDLYQVAVLDYQMRSRIMDSHDPQTYRTWAAEATTTLTQREVWAVGMERLSLLHALAQIRKCVGRLKNDDLPRVRNDNFIRMLRDADEHWEQGEECRSLNQLQKTFPDLAPGVIRSDGKRVWFGDLQLDELMDWVEEVDRGVRERAGAAGASIMLPDEIFPEVEPEK